MEESGRVLGGEVTVSQVWDRYASPSKPVKSFLISAKDIDDYLGNLPKHKFHCSVLGHEALAEAIKNYREKTSLNL